MNTKKLIDQLKIIKNVCSRVPRYRSPETACLAEWYLEQLEVGNNEILPEIEAFIADAIERHIPEHFLLW